MIRMKCGDVGTYTNRYQYVFIGLEGNKPCKELSAYVKGAPKP
jgi:hypothetical protein